MDKQRLPIRLLFGRLSHGSRPPGAPRRRWIDVVSTDLKALHIENNWSILCQDRAKWSQIVFSTRGIGRLVHQRRVRTSSSTPSATDNYIGRRIRVLFKVGTSLRWYIGRVSHYDNNRQEYLVKFRDGDTIYTPLPTNDHYIQMINESHTMADRIGTVAGGAGRRVLWSPYDSCIAS